MSKTALMQYIELDGKPATRDNKTIAKIAKKTKLSVETIYRASLGDRIPSARSAIKIAKATNGVVSAASIAGL